jgi:hypothetical protein
MSTISVERCETAPKFLFDQKLPRFFTNTDRDAFTRSVGILRYFVDAGHLDFSKPVRAVDFGAGTGAPTWALCQYVGNLGVVTAVEHDELKARQMIRNGILPPDQVQATDGLSYLDQKAREQDYSDLITCFSPWPDPQGRFLPKLIDSSLRALDDSGNLLINTAYRTTDATINICVSQGLTYTLMPNQAIQSHHQSSNVPSYDTIVVPRS